jgi:large subunit ribosomal protein L22
MTGPKLNEQPVLRTSPTGPARAVEPGGTSARAVARYVRVSAYKVREVLDLIRGQDAERAQETLQFCERDAAAVVGKVLRSAIANAEHNGEVPAEELFVSACYADEGPTLKRWRPRARGRATRIRKRTCHVTVVVSRLPETELRKRRAARVPGAADRRRRVSRSGPSPERERRVQASRRRDQDQEAAPVGATAAPELEPEIDPVAAPEPETEVAAPADAAPADADPTGATETTDDATSNDDERAE